VTGAGLFNGDDQASRRACAPRDRLHGLAPVATSSERHSLAAPNAFAYEAAKVVDRRVDMNRARDGESVEDPDFRMLRRVLDLELNAVLDAPAIARAAIRKELAGLPTEVLDGVLLVVSELVANSVIHARSTACITIDVGDGIVRGEVVDAGIRAPELRESAHWDADGRGLLIVRRIADRCGWTQLDDGKSVWFEITYPVDRSN
jgi:anti-sigma regulatory factor (Ser/Thr protein kinase)